MGGKHYLYVAIREIFYSTKMNGKICTLSLHLKNYKSCPKNTTTSNHHAYNLIIYIECNNRNCHYFFPLYLSTLNTTFVSFFLWLSPLWCVCRAVEAEFYFKAQTRSNSHRASSSLNRASISSKLLPLVSGRKK